MNVHSRLPPPFLPLFAAYPVLFIAGANPGQAQFTTVLAVAFAAIAAAVFCWLILRAVAASAQAAAIAVVVLVAMFFGYGYFANWLDAFVGSLLLGDFETPNILDLVPRSRFYVAIAWGVLALLVTVLVARSRWAQKPELPKALSVAAAVLVAITALQIGSAQLRAATSHPLLADRQGAATGVERAAERHDIYFIVLDGYARQDVLEKYYRFDNGDFLRQLRSRGLQVSTQGSSNYAWTFLSLVSTLNMRYVADLFEGRLGPESLDRSIVYDAIRDNDVARFLRGQGYEIVHLRSTWGATSVNPYADREIRCESSVYTDEFVRAVAESSWLGAFHTKAGVDLAHCNLAGFRALQSLPASDQPRFVFAHFVLPHHPYLFDKDGRILRNAVVSNQFEFQKQLWEDRDSYRDQLQFVNRKVIETVDALLAKPGPRPIIVLESDHGPGFARGMSEVDYYAVRFANFGAYYLPGAPADLMPPTGSAVNQFRRILGHYFGADLPPLPDRHFASPNSMPYAFREMPHDFLVKSWTRMNAERQADDPVSTATPPSGVDR
jgi:hypothetical protein